MTLSIPLATLLANDTDADALLSNTLSISGVSGAVGSTVRIEGGSIIFTPSTNVNGPASFTYTVTDAKGATANGTVSLTITPVNDAPTGTSTATLGGGYRDR